MRKLAFTRILIPILFILFPVFLSAGTEIQSKFGDVRIQHQGTVKWIPAAVKMVLQPYDIIQTGSRSGAMIFIGGSENIISIEQNSKIVLTENMKETVKKPGFLVFAGKMKCRLQKNAAGAEEFSTPTAVVGVRGTEFIIAVADDGTSQIGVLKGAVAVNGQTGNVALASNESSLVPLAGAPADKVEFSGAENWDEWIKTQSESLQGRELEVLDQVGQALDFIYGRMDALEQSKADSLNQIEALKTLQKQAQTTGDTNAFRRSGEEITRLVTARTRFIIDGHNLDLRIQAIFEIASRIRAKNPDRKDLRDKTAALEKKFNTYHNRYIIAPQKKGCLGL